jgi:hypothetical protein
MSENRFFSGNVIVVYCKFVKLDSEDQLPQHIMERIAVCNRIYERIMKSKPDKSNTIIQVAADMKVGGMIKDILLNNGIEESKIIVEASYNNMDRLFSGIIDEIKKRSNPPVIYFISSYQQKDIFDLATASYKEYKIQFEGALDKRPTVNIEEDSKKERLSRSFTNIKEKGKNKMIDMLLNYIFPESRKS